MSTTPFPALVDSYRRKAAPKGKRPLTYGVVAKRLGISRQYLYLLMSGDKEASDKVEKKIAKVFALAERTVACSLALSRATG